MAPRFVPTSRLSNIVQMITLSGQTGILRVARGQGGSRELGQIQFLGGDPVSALLGSLTGASALNVLQNWGECLYTFEANGATAPGESTPSFTTESGGSSSYPQAPAQSWPSYGYPSGYPSGVSGGLSPAPPSYPSGGYAPAALTGYSAGPSFTPPPSGEAGTLPNLDSTPPASSVTTRVSSTSLPGAASAEVMRAVPSRTMLAEQIETLPLDRRERMVLMLVDGHRTFADLVRLTRRSDSEVFAVLDHLQMLRLIRFTN